MIKPREQQERESAMVNQLRHDSHLRSRNRHKAAESAQDLIVRCVVGDLIALYVLRSNRGADAETKYDSTNGINVANYGSDAR